MMHFLPTLCTRVGDDSKTTLWVGSAAFLRRKFGCQHHHAPQKACVLGLKLRKRRDVHLRNHQKMHGCPGVDVMERKDFIVLENHF